jgi:hypothetical protein
VSSSSSLLVDLVDCLFEPDLDLAFDADLEDLDLVSDFLDQDERLLIDAPLPLSSDSCDDETLELSEVPRLGLLGGFLRLFPLLPLDGLLFLPDLPVLPFLWRRGQEFSGLLPSFPTSSGSLGATVGGPSQGTRVTLVVWRFSTAQGKGGSVAHDPGSVIVSLQRRTRLRLAGSWSLIAGSPALWLFWSPGNDDQVLGRGAFHSSAAGYPGAFLYIPARHVP